MIGLIVLSEVFIVSLGENIRSRRIALNMSQQALADALGYKTRSSIAKLEKDVTSLTQDKLVTLANTLQTSVNYLLTGEHSETTSPRGTVIANLPEMNPVKDKRKCVAVVLAGGSMHLNAYRIPFQFVTVKEKPVILYTMETLQRHPQIDEIHVVCLEGWEDFLPAYARQYGITKLREIIPAGRTGMESVKNAIEWLSPSHSASDIMVIQEATRPFVDPETISNAIRICKQYGSAVVFERMDRLTPFLLAESGPGLTHLPATRLINVQSPEAYSFGMLRQVLLEAVSIRHPLDETICAVFLHHMGRELKFCEGSHSNLRIVYEEDLKLLEALV